MRDATIARATRRQISREGTAIDLIDYADGGDSEFGEQRGAESTQTVQAVVAPPNGDRDPDQWGIADVDVQVEITLSDEINVTDGGGRLSTLVDTDQNGEPEYVVDVAVDQQNGSQLLFCSDAPNVEP